MSPVRLPGSDLAMWVGQEVLSDKWSGGKLGGKFKIHPLPLKRSPYSWLT